MTAWRDTASPSTGGGAGGFSDINVLSGSHIITAPITLVDDLQVLSTAGAGIALNGPIAESTAGKVLSLIGTGSFTLGGTTANSYTGLTTVDVGVLNLNKSPGVSAVGSGGLQINASATTNLLASEQILDTASVLNNGTFNIGANVETIGSIAGSGRVATSAGGILTIGSTNNLDSQFDGLISGTGTIAKGGTGTLTLTNSNTFGGMGQTVALNAGRLLWNANASLGSTANSVTFNGGTLVFASSFASLGSATSNVDLGAGTLAVGATLTSNHTLVVSNSASTVQVDPGQTFTSTGAISGSGGLTKTGAGTVALNGAGTFTGDTRVTSGTVIAGATSGSSLGSTGAISIETGAQLDLARTIRSMTRLRSLLLAALWAAAGSVKARRRPWGWAPLI